MAEAIAVRLMLWAIPWVALALWLLWKSPGEFWRAFGLMSGLWGLVNMVIAVSGSLGLGPAEPSPDTLRRILWINTALDVLYVLLGLWLYRQKSLTRKGFGLAVMIQGGFLFFFDLFHALQI